MMRTFKIYSLNNFQIYSTLLLIVVTMLCITSLWLYFINGSLFLLTPFTSCEELTLEKTLKLGGIGGRRRRGWQRMRWLDGIADSMDVSWWWTGRPGVLRFMGSQRVGHDWVTDLIWPNLINLNPKFMSEFKLCVIDSMGLDRCIMKCVHYDNIKSYRIISLP